LITNPDALFDEVVLVRLQLVLQLLLLSLHLARLVLGPCGIYGCCGVVGSHQSEVLGQGKI